MRRTNEYTNKILYYKISRSPEKSIRNPCFMHHRPLSVPRVSRFARTRIQEYCSVQRYSRYSSPLRNGKDGTGRGGSGELVIKEGELGCVPFRGRPVRLKLSNFTPRVPSFLPWRPRWWSVRQTVCGDVEIRSSSICFCFRYYLRSKLGMPTEDVELWYIRKFRPVRIELVSVRYNSTVWNEVFFILYYRKI